MHLERLFVFYGCWSRDLILIGTARSLEDETRNGERNANRNPEWWGDFSQLVKIEKIEFLGISPYKVHLRFWLDLNSELSRGTDSNWDFCLIWIYIWLKSSHHSGFRFAFRWPFRVSSSSERAVLELSKWNDRFFGKLWGPPNLSSSCDNKYTYVKHVSFKNIIFGRYQIIKKPLRIHAKSLSDALAPSKKIVSGAGLRRLCEASA